MYATTTATASATTITRKTNYEVDEFKAFIMILTRDGSFVRTIKMRSGEGYSPSVPLQCFCKHCEKWRILSVSMKDP